MSNQRITNHVNEVSVFRLYLLRALYLLMIVGLGIVQWPEIIHREEPWELMEGVVACMLGAFSALAIVGLRYPLQMLPLLMWEMAWKLLWVIVVAIPLWINGTMDEAHGSVFSSFLLMVLFPFVIPWGYVWKHYVKKHGDRWR
jgi:hypothetical protein